MFGFVFNHDLVVVVEFELRWSAHGSPRDMGCNGHAIQHGWIHEYALGHGLPGSERVGEGAGGDLGLVEVRREIEVRGADEFLEFLELDEAVVEDELLLDLVLLGQPFEAEQLRLPVFAHQVGGRPPEDADTQPLHNS